MPYAVITYDVEAGHEDEIAGIFGAFRRVDTPTLRDEDGNPVGRLLGTAVFIKGELMVRVIHYEGDFAAIGRHMATQRGVHLLEEKLAPYLKRKRDTGTVEGFGSYFRDATMRCISQLSVDTHPEGGHPEAERSEGGRSEGAQAGGRHPEGGHAGAGNPGAAQLDAEPVKG
ncbi:SchA/CurD-like domain-containing protein [Actinosynnema sp. CS-041913]|uniref:SchA/CurD-like domain-containing protein n=1 Tax=Actinosynnema sp. CS-041913 TaxID=3239917 RepID=UPI003D8A565B